MILFDWLLNVDSDSRQVWISVMYRRIFHVMLIAIGQMGSLRGLKSKSHTIIYTITL